MKVYNTKYGGINIELIKTDSSNGMQTYEMYHCETDEYFGWLECHSNETITDALVEKTIDNHHKGLFQ